MAARNASRYFISAYSRVWGVVARQVTRGRSCSRLALPALNSAALRSRIGAESPRQTQSEPEPEILRLSSCNGPSYSFGNLERPLTCRQPCPRNAAGPDVFRAWNKEKRAAGGSSPWFKMLLASGEVGTGPVAPNNS